MIPNFAKAVPVIPVISERWEFDTRVVFKSGAEASYYLHNGAFEDEFGRDVDGRSHKISSLETAFGEKVVGHLVHCWIKREIQTKFNDDLETLQVVYQKHTKQTLRYEGRGLWIQEDFNREFCKKNEGVLENTALKTTDKKV